jgi:hypothetical protein
MPKTVTLNLSLASEVENEDYPDSGVDVTVPKSFKSNDIAWREAMSAARAAFVQSLKDSGVKVSDTCNFS